MRSEQEIRTALQEMVDRQWYDRSKLIAESDLDPENTGAEGRRQLEERYDDLGPYTEQGWGELRGKRAALQWVLGDKWDAPQDT